MNFSPFPHSLSISSLSLHFLSVSSSFPHSLFISSQPSCKAATIRAALIAIILGGLKYGGKKHLDILAKYRPLYYEENIP